METINSKLSLRLSFYNIKEQRNQLRFLCLGLIN